MNFFNSLCWPFVRMRRSQKRQEMSNPDNENRNEDAVAGSTNVESPPELFQLNIDCFNEIFEYLCLKELHSFGQTCKRMNKVAGEYFKQNYSSAKKWCQKDGIYTTCSDGFVLKSIQTSGFIRFMPCISHYSNNSGLEYTKSHINEFESTNHIYLRYVDIEKKTVRYFKKLLPQLEIVHMKWCSRIYGDFYDLILKYCKNLREIYVEDSSAGNRKNGKLNWLLQEYPKLERLHLTPIYDTERIEELREFFVCNPNVQRFSINARLLWANGDILLNSNAKLDILELIGRPLYSKQKTSLELLNQLHEQGFYKRLHIYIFDTKDEISTKLDLVNGLELLYIHKMRKDYKKYNFDQLTNLILIIRRGCDNGEDMEILANGLTKLNRLCIYGPNTDVIMPFICRSLKLNKIKFIITYTRVALNLEMLNEERAKLVGARKITIYVREDCYLATKWTTRNGDTNLSFIEVRRSDSIEWNPYNFPWGC